MRLSQRPTPEYRHPRENVFTRGRDSIKTIAASVLLPVMVVWSAGASAKLIDFENLTAASGTFIPQGYSGFAWLGGGHSGGTASWVNSAFDELCDPTPVCEKGTARSGVNYAWSNGGTELALADGLFDIQSLWVSFRANPRLFPELNVVFEGLLDGNKIHSATLLLANNNEYRQAALNFSGIDTLRFRGEVNHNLLVDDISFSRAAVHVPGTALLLCLGLAAIGWLNRERDKVRQ